MREIYTYANPLLMNKDSLVWEMVKKYPQFCASDTLSQGMIQHYGRKQFGIIQTINDLQKALVGDVTDDSQFDMQLFLTVSHEIRKSSCNSDIKRSFQNNKSSIVQAIRYLLLLNADPEKLYEIDNASIEQKELFNIYKHVYLRFKSKIDQLMQKKRETVETAIRNTVCNEAEFLIKKNKKYLGEDNSYVNDLIQARKKLNRISESLNKQIEGRHGVEYSNTAKTKKQKERIDYLIELIDKLDSLDVSTIIIHGVHKFTPELLLTLRVLENQGIEVRFLIHYLDNLPQVYGTWREVYSWTGLDFKNVHPFCIEAGSRTGREIAKIYSGKLSLENLNSYKTSYDNLSDFAVGEVRQTFNQAGRELSKMKTQYYAVNNTETNEILKNYFPEQFEIKPFLSYPIGQFILGLYNMWDFDNSRMRIIPESLRECIVSGVFENETGKNLSEVYDDIALYIADLVDVDDVLNRLKQLKIVKQSIEKKKEYLGDIQAICYFSRSARDIDRLGKYVKLITELSNQIFGQQQDQVSFNSHFKNLMEVLEQPINNAALVQKAELQLVKEILGALAEHRGNDVIGDFADVKEALNYFLHQSNSDDSSNWIVRNFEQLDGAVLLADSTKAREYHFALMSMKNMTRNANDELPWPLNEKVFYSYDCDLKSSIQASALSIKERTNFLKYSLFYATFFFKKRIIFSYIVNQNDEKQRAYYLFDLLRLREVNKEENADINFGDSIPIEKEKEFDYDSLTIDQREMFAICKYKYFLNKVLGERIVYKDDFQIRFFLQNFIVRLVLDNDKLTLQNHVRLTRKYAGYFHNMFPNYDQMTFADIERRAIKEVNKSLEYSIKYHKGHKQDEYYKRRKKNFLLAQWVDNGSKKMSFDNISRNDVEDYMFDDNNLLTIENRPHSKVCENCNYSTDCLMNYYDRLSRKDTEV